MKRKERKGVKVDGWMIESLHFGNHRRAKGEISKLAIKKTVD